MSVISIQSLNVDIRPHFWSKRRTILDQVCLDVEPGEIFGFLGPNGAGKTTTIKTLLGLLRPNSGSITIFDGAPTDVAVRRRMGYMPEHAYFPEQLKAIELLRVHGMLAGLNYATAKQRGYEALELTGMASSAHERLRGFSKGMLQRVGLAQAIVGDPDLVILDEPMSGLDPIGRRDIREIMVSLRQRGKTVFFSTHILPDVEMICDRVGIIVAGKARKAGSLTELVQSGVARVEVWVGGLDPQARLALSQLNPKIEERGGQLALEVPDTATANHLIDVLRQRGVEIQDMQVIRPSLEDLFVQETQRAVP